MPTDGPGRMLPEFATPCSGPFDSERWWFSVDWEGTRTLLVTDGHGGAHLQGERLEDISARFPEVLAAAAPMRDQALVLDGVVTVLDASGRPDLGALALRTAVCADGRPPSASVVFLVTDLLHHDGAALTGWPLRRRIELLATIVVADACLQVPEYVVRDGIALADAAAARGLSGVLARERRSRYCSGAASPSRLHIPLDERTTCVVAGIEFRGATVAALLLAEMVDGHLTLAGRLQWSPEPAMAPWLQGRLAGLHREGSPCDAVVARAGTSWLRPGLCVTVTHSGRTARGQLRHPRYLALRDDVDPRRCVRRSPLPPPTAETGGFRPTVLHPLPFGED